MVWSLTKHFGVMSVKPNKIVEIDIIRKICVSQKTFRVTIVYLKFFFYLFSPYLFKSKSKIDNTKIQIAATFFLFCQPIRFNLMAVYFCR